MSAPTDALRRLATDQAATTAEASAGGRTLAAHSGQPG